MNLLQQFLADCNQQTRPILQEEFTIEGDDTIYFGTFGDPQVIPVMARQGYQDHLVQPLKAERVQWPTTPPPAKKNLVRTQTNRTFFIQAVNTTEAVVYTFILTDRDIL